MNPDHITPMILTWNEEANIQRCLQRLDWAGDILVVDSFSDDRTLEVCAEYSEVRVVQRPLDSLAEQANFGMSKITTPWVLSLDADYILPEGFDDALAEFDASDLSGASAEFFYCIFGKPLRGNLYPSRVVLHQTQDVRYIQDGHAHRVTVPGKIASLGIKIDHDDRKPLVRWFSSQSGYARLEAKKLLNADLRELSRPDRLRLMGWVAPWLVGFWCLIVKGCLLDGRAGFYYTFQRMFAELALSLCLFEARLKGKNP